MHAPDAGGFGSCLRRLKEIMPLKVIGLGLSRTGTYSLKLALNQLGLGPCHHMEEVLIDMPRQMPLWQGALAGRLDFATIYDGYYAAVDLPTAGYYRELHAAYPEAKFLLTHRSTESWVASFSSTVDRLLSIGEAASAPMREWIVMSKALIAKAGLPLDPDEAALGEAFEKHIAAVKATIPANRLLVYEVKEGWEPLCAFLGVPVPEGPFPRTNNRDQFWYRMATLA